MKWFGQLAVVALSAFIFCVASSMLAGANAADLRVGFAEADITPSMTESVWLAGYAPGRKARGIHDRLFARCICLHDVQRNKTTALISVDLVGLPLPIVERIRKQVPKVDYLLVSSTHNHEGPDVIGLWGPHPLRTGVNPAYIDKLVELVAKTALTAAAAMQPAAAAFGTAEDGSLLHDGRLPSVKDSIIRVLKFHAATATGGIANGDKPLGVMLQWNCHPETLGSRNKLLTADFPSATVTALKDRYQCPVVYFSGALGGLMAPPRGRIKNAAGEVLAEGDFAFAEKYGQAVAKLASQALDKAAPIKLTPISVHTQVIAVPVGNAWYRAARALGVVRREGFLWTGDPHKLGPLITKMDRQQVSAVKSEVGYLRLGELHVACIPGEIYPELVYGRFQQPVEKNADFPEATPEPHITSLLPANAKWMLLGLANDELGYFIPKCQWDAKSPYAYNRRSSQYGEMHSCGPDAAAAVMAGFRQAIAAAAED